MGGSNPGGLHDRIGGSLRVGESNVLADRAGEEQGILGHDADLTAQRIELNLVNVIAIHQDSSFGG